jgi:hypothetical protein
MNYAELVTAVQDYTANTDATFVASIPTFIKSAEFRIYGAIQLPAESFYDYADVTANNRFLVMPAGFIDVQQLARLPVGGAGAQEFLLQKEVTFIRECWPNPTDTGPPKVYGVVDPTTLMLGPTPDQQYRVEMQYTKFPETIVTADTTWLSENYPNTLLYGTLVEAYTFMKGDEDMLKQYASLLADGIASLRQYADVDVQTSFYRHGRSSGGPQA